MKDLIRADVLVNGKPYCVVYSSRHYTGFEALAGQLFGDECDIKYISLSKVDRHVLMDKLLLDTLQGGYVVYGNTCVLKDGNRYACIPVDAYTECLTEKIGGVRLLWNGNNTPNFNVVLWDKRRYKGYSDRDVVVNILSRWMGFDEGGVPRLVMEELDNSTVAGLMKDCHIGVNDIGSFHIINERG